MKTTIFTILFLFVINIANACCDGRFVNVYPSGEEVSKNPIFLINYSERDYSIFNKLKASYFYIEYEDGRQVELEIIEKNKASSTMAQFVLKPKRKLKLNRSFSIKVKSLEVSSHFVQLIEYRKWKVTHKKDRKPPHFNSILNYSYYSDFNSSAPGHRLKFKLEYSDNQNLWFKRPKINQKKITEILIKVTNDKGFSYILPVQNNYSTIYNGMCGSIFIMGRNKKYEFSVQLLDMSGNLSVNKLPLKFETRKKRINKGG